LNDLIEGHARGRAEVEEGRAVAHVVIVSICPARAGLSPAHRRMGFALCAGATVR
jgi:hypothetical protein